MCRLTDGGVQTKLMIDLWVPDLVALTSDHPGVCWLQSLVVVIVGGRSFSLQMSFCAAEGTAQLV